jgi:hypothetical protein
MTNLPVLNPWSRIFSALSPDYQPGDEGLPDKCGVVVRSVDQVTLLPPATESDNTNPVLCWRRFMRSIVGRRFCDNTPPYRLGPVLYAVRILLCAPARGGRRVRIRYQQHVYRR